MSFRVTARTILHLGSELISSDGVAFYELIKNALDARSPEIRVDVVSRLDFDTYDRILRELGERRDPSEWVVARPAEQGRSWQELRQIALKGIDDDAPEAEELREAIEAAKNRTQFIEAVRSSNRIEVDDDGDGMSIDTLKEVYLTIGTSNRARERDAARRRRTSTDDQHVILGEKGLGRLSAMRLGNAMEVVTGTVDSDHWNVLRIDWTDFANAADEDISSVMIEPIEGDRKTRSQQGTVIRITALTSSWSYKKLEDLARDNFSKLVDPFSEKRLPLVLHFNGIPVSIPPFASFILQHAHGIFSADFEVPKKGEPRLSGKMNYRLRNRRRSFDFKGSEVAEMAGDVSRDTLRRIGPFKLEVYWFNRRVLTKIEGIGDLAQVRRLLASWAGGVSLYRDGYRVMPTCCRICRPLASMLTAPVRRPTKQSTP